MFELLKERRRLFGDAFWALFGQLASAIALLAGTRVLTELVTPDIFGQVALLNGFVALGVTLFSYPFICAGMRILPECLEKWERAALYEVVANLTAQSTALAIGLLVLGGFIYSYFSHSDFWLYMLAGILLMVTVRRELGIQLLIGARKQRDASLWQTCDSFLRPLLAISLVWWGGQKAEWVLLGYILASMLSNTVWSFIQGTKSDKNNRPIIARNFRTEVWVYALPLIPMELIFWVNGLGDRYVIGYFMTAAEVGLYAATYTIINEAFNRSAMVLLRTFQPVYFQSFYQNQTRKGSRILWIWIACVFALGIIGVSLLLVTKDWVAFWVLAKSYHSAVDLMPAIAIGCALHALGTVVAQPLLANKQTQLLLLGRVCGAVTAAISIPLMVKNYGLPGAAMANPIYFGVEALVLAMLAKPWRIIDSGNNDATDQAQEEIPARKAQGSRDKHVALTFN
jgi:O-antigen/teichoic acid export membrane protein